MKLKLGELNEREGFLPILDENGIEVGRWDTRNCLLEEVKAEAEEVILRNNIFLDLLTACTETRKSTYLFGAIKIRDYLDKLLDKAILAAGEQIEER